MLLPFGGFRNLALLNNSRLQIQKGWGWITPFREEITMKRLILVPILLVVAMTLITPSSYAIEIKFAFVFVDRFPEESEKLGFIPGNVLQVGATVKPTDFAIMEATARNLDTGLVLDLAPRQLGAAFTNLEFLHWPFPPVDPDKHKGVWEIRLRDEKGNEAVAKTHRLDKVGAFPYVGNIKVSGNQLAPLITWDAPEKEAVPAGCEIKYRVRLLKNNGNQFYKSKKLLTDTKEQIPEGFLKLEDISDTYVRIESQCWDADDKDQPVPVELKSETFRPLKEAWGQ